jgi:hypothetical protein
MSVSDGARSPSQTNKPGSPASRFLVGVLGTLFTLLAICTLVLTKPYVVRAVRRLETARQQRVAVDHTIEKRKLARKPKLQECWIDCQGLEGIRLDESHGTMWSDLQVCLHTSHPIEMSFVDVEMWAIQPLSADLEHTPPPAYTTVAPVVADPFARLPIRSPGTERTEPTRPWRVRRPQPQPQPHQRPWTPNSDGLVQLTLFVAMPTPSRPLFSPRSRPSSRHPEYHDLSSPYTHQNSFTGTNIHQELTLGLTSTPFIPDFGSSLSSSASEAQKQPGPSL